MPLIKSEYACPICEAQTGQHHQICANAGELVCSFNGQHKWNDAPSFMAMNPKMVFKVPPPQFAPQKNLTPVQLSIPIEIKNALDAKFGDKLSATLSGILQQMVEGEVMVIPELDLERISSGEGLGKRPQNSSELFGMIYSLRMEVMDAKNTAEAAAKDLQAYRGISPGRVVVDLGDLYAEAQSRAANAEPPLPVDMYVAKCIKEGLRDNWF